MKKHPIYLPRKKKPSLSLKIASYSVSSPKQPIKLRQPSWLKFDETQGMFCRTNARTLAQTPVYTAGGNGLRLKQGWGAERGGSNPVPLTRAHSRLLF